jgi:hypothetical protein
MSFVLVDLTNDNDAPARAAPVKKAPAIKNKTIAAIDNAKEDDEENAINQSALSTQATVSLGQQREARKLRRETAKTSDLFGALEHKIPTCVSLESLAAIKKSIVGVGPLPDSFQSLQTVSEQQLFGMWTATEKQLAMANGRAAREARLHNEALQVCGCV